MPGEQNDVKEKDLVLVTGSSGYVASHVVQQLLQSRSYRVRGTVRSLKNYEKVDPVRNLARGCPEGSLELVEANLTDTQGWSAAVKGCDYVIHVASPVPDVNRFVSMEEFVKPAVEGTLTVLRACANERTVRRVVMTSSTVAVVYGQKRPEGYVYTEADWSDPELTNQGYIRSKILAERAAWDFMDELPGDRNMELAVMNPGFILGPALCGGRATSLEAFIPMLTGWAPLLPRLTYPCIDVRDVAAAHISALTAPGAAGHRHILTSKNLSFIDMAVILRDEFQPQGYTIYCWGAPDLIMWLAGLFSRMVRMTWPYLGRVDELSHARMEEVLKVTPRCVRQAVVDTGYNIIELGYVQKKDKYRSQNNLNVKIKTL